MPGRSYNDEVSKQPQATCASAPGSAVHARDYLVTGVVQGVGFRPFVYRAAREHGLVGWVLNAGDGVHIHAEGSLEGLDGLGDALVQDAPPRSQVETVEAVESAVEGYDEFEIHLSDKVQAARTLVSPDIATCPDCVAELFDPTNRRYHYPFINCTQCGPRFTIIRALPYDRASTSMQTFEMCPECDAEYHDPGNRRFHAQPDACFACGPELSWSEAGSASVAATNREESDALIARAAKLLDRGKILAIKGLGGYHLACDAANEDAVERLRQRKHRPDKPFAIMAGSLAAAQAIARISPQEQEILEGSVRPIVLLRLREKSSGCPLAPSVCKGLSEVGVMLPYTPVQHLLLAEYGHPLVMTSGNMSEEPIIADDSKATELLAEVADAFLANDRPIVSRYDDSVVRVIDGETASVRRARGYAPRPLPLPRQLRGLTPVLACGPQQKATFCFTRDDSAFVSQHLGDLDDEGSFAAWRDSMWLYRRLFDLTATAFACDMHPGYLSTKWAVEHGEGYGIPLERVQHHHAHIAAVTGEHGISEQVIGVALDGTGYGGDGTVWGGEVLICDWTGFSRFAHLRHMPLPGGEAAIMHPARLAWTLLEQCDLEGHPGAQLVREALSPEEMRIASQLVARGINSPLTSSTGRLLDAFSAILGICPYASYDGEPAAELEAAMGTLEEQAEVDAPQRYRFALHEDGTDAPLVIDPAPAVAAVLADIADGTSKDVIARRVHDSLATAIVDACLRAHEKTSIGTVALGGGVFMNRRLLQTIRGMLRESGLDVITGRELPANDGCISYGQAIVALARQKERMG